MSRVDGVQAYIIRTFHDRELTRKRIEQLVGDAAGPEVTAEVMLQLTILQHRSEDLGSMRRLMGQLKQAEAEELLAARRAAILEAYVHTQPPIG